MAETAVLHVVAPLLTLQQLRERLAPVAGDPRFTVAVRDGWDGPQAWVGCPADPGAAGEVERALRGPAGGPAGAVAAGFGAVPTAGEGGAASGPFPAAAGLPFEAAAGLALAAWQELLLRRPAQERSRYGFALHAEPVLPDGWLLRSWDNPALGPVQFTVRPGPRLAVAAPGRTGREEAAALLAEWTLLLARSSVTPG
ncbi:hypothetical protein ACFW1A_08535 [Kitasatospora sp. NPDC058965]|uniref:hypothetical protein n=1 Tax=Kitasatospora sp. NPDC058965 TaxID=3346682 RepID=UPI0036C8CD1A